MDNSELSEDVVASETVYVHDAETVQHKSRKKLSKTKIAFQTSTLNGKLFSCYFNCFCDVGKFLSSCDTGLLKIIISCLA